MDSNMGTGPEDMIVKRVSVPIGLEELMEGLVKEVLLKKPEDIYLFAARYFTHLLTIRDKVPVNKAKTLRTIQTLKDKNTNCTRTAKLSKQLSIREDTTLPQLDSPIISQKPKMYHRNDLKYKRRHTGPPTTLPNTQQLVMRRKYARSVSSEKQQPPASNNNKISKNTYKTGHEKNNNTTNLHIVVESKNTTKENNNDQADNVIVDEQTEKISNTEKDTTQTKTDNKKTLPEFPTNLKEQSQSNDKKIVDIIKENQTQIKNSDNLLAQGTDVIIKNKAVIESYKQNIITGVENISNDSANQTLENNKEINQNNSIQKETFHLVYMNENESANLKEHHESVTETTKDKELNDELKFPLKRTIDDDEVSQVLLSSISNSENDNSTSPAQEQSLEKNVESILEKNKDIIDDTKAIIERPLSRDSLEITDIEKMLITDSPAHSIKCHNIIVMETEEQENETGFNTDSLIAEEIETLKEVNEYIPTAMPTNNAMLEEKITIGKLNQTDKQVELIKEQSVGKEITTDIDKVFSEETNSKINTELSHQTTEKKVDVEDGEKQTGQKDINPSINQNYNGSEVNKTEITAEDKNVDINLKQHLNVEITKLTEIKQKDMDYDINKKNLVSDENNIIKLVESKNTEIIKEQKIVQIDEANDKSQADDKELKKITVEELAIEKNNHETNEIKLNDIAEIFVDSKPATNKDSPDYKRSEQIMEENAETIIKNDDDKLGNTLAPLMIGKDVIKELVDQQFPIVKKDKPIDSKITMLYQEIEPTANQPINENVTSIEYDFDKTEQTVKEIVTNQIAELDKDKNIDKSYETKPTDNKRREKLEGINNLNLNNKATDLSKNNDNSINIYINEKCSNDIENNNDMIKSVDEIDANIVHNDFIEGQKPKENITERKDKTDNKILDETIGIFNVSDAAEKLVIIDTKEVISDAINIKTIDDTECKDNSNEKETTINEKTIISNNFVDYDDDKNLEIKDKKGNEHEKIPYIDCDQSKTTNLNDSEKTVVTNKETIEDTNIDKQTLKVPSTGFVIQKIFTEVTPDKSRTDSITKSLAEEIVNDISHSTNLLRDSGHSIIENINDLKTEIVPKNNISNDNSPNNIQTPDQGLVTEDIDTTPDIKSTVDDQDRFKATEATNIPTTQLECKELINLEISGKDPIWESKNYDNNKDKFEDSTTIENIRLQQDVDGNKSGQNTYNEIQDNTNIPAVTAIKLNEEDNSYDVNPRTEVKLEETENTLYTDEDKTILVDDVIDVNDDKYKNFNNVKVTGDTVVVQNNVDEIKNVLEDSLKENTLSEGNSVKIEKENFTLNNVPKESNENNNIQLKVNNKEEYNLVEKPSTNIDKETIDTINDVLKESNKNNNIELKDNDEKDDNLGEKTSTNIGKEAMDIDKFKEIMDTKHVEKNIFDEKESIIDKENDNPINVSNTDNDIEKLIYNKFKPDINTTSQTNSTNITTEKINTDVENRTDLKENADQIVQQNINIQPSSDVTTETTDKETEDIINSKRVKRNTSSEDDTHLTNFTEDIAETNLVDRVAKNYVNYVIDNDRYLLTDNDISAIDEGELGLIENENTDTKSDDSSSITENIDEHKQKVKDTPEELINSTIAIAETGLVEHKVKKFINDFIARERVSNGDYVEHKGPDYVPKQSTSFNSSKLRDELKKVEEEAKFSTFKPSFNPYLLRQEIEEASNIKQNKDVIVTSQNFSEVLAAVLKIQSIWRGYQIRRNITKSIPDYKDVLANKIKQTNEAGKRKEIKEEQNFANTVQAARVIQKMWRKFKSRSNIEVLNQARKNNEETIKQLTDSTDHLPSQILESQIASNLVETEKQSRLTQDKDENQHDVGRIFSAESTDSVKTVIHNEYDDALKPKVYQEAGNPKNVAEMTVNQNDSISDAAKHSVHPGKIGLLLDEILDYPTVKEENLLDNYQNKLLDKISGKPSEDDLTALENIISPKHIENINLEQLKEEVHSPFVKNVASDKKQTRSMSQKLDILEEEEGSTADETADADDNKLYTFCSTPIPVVCNNKLISGKNLIEYIETVPAVEHSCGIDKSSEMYEKNQIETSLSSSHLQEEEKIKAQDSRNVPETMINVDTKNVNNSMNPLYSNEVNTTSVEIPSSPKSKKECNEILKPFPCQEVNEITKRLQSEKEGNTISTLNEIKETLEHLHPQEVEEKSQLLQADKEGNELSELIFSKEVEEILHSQDVKETSQHLQSAKEVNETSNSFLKGEIKEPWEQPQEVKESSQPLQSKEKVNKTLNVPVSEEVKKPSKHCNSQEVNETSKPLYSKEIKQTPDQSKEVKETLDSVDSKEVKETSKPLQFDDSNETLKLLVPGEVNETLVIPLPTEVKDKFKKTDSSEKKSTESLNLDRILSVLSNAGINSEDVHETVVVPVHEQNIDTHRSQPISVQLCQTSDAETMMTSRASPTDVTASGSSCRNAQESGKVDLPNDVQFEFENADDHKESMESEKRRKTEGANMEAQAATKIQAGFRGYQVRKQLKQTNCSSNTLPQTKLNRTSGNLTSKQKKSADIEEESAVKIQAGIRGFLVRRRQKKHTSQQA